MKLQIGSTGITLGGGPNWWLRQAEGLDPQMDNVTTVIPRTDFGKDINEFLRSFVKSFSGHLVGDDADDFRTKKRTFKGLIENSYTFTLTDDYVNADGTTTTFETYRFEGKVIEASVPDAMSYANTGEYILQIYTESPIIELNTLVSETVDIEIQGFTFPMIFPLVFAGGDNQITLTNTGLVDVYPTITVTGGTSELRIVTGANDLFSYDSTIPEGSSLVLTPVPTDPIKARLDGENVLKNTNANFSALTVHPGQNIFSFFGADVSGTPQATLEVRYGYAGI